MVASATLLAGLALLVALAVLAVVWRVERRLPTDGAVDTDKLTAALGRTFTDLEFQETVTRLETHAADISDHHHSIERMLRSPRERGEFGEHQLDVILADHLPEDMYGVREQVVDGKTPDAHIESSAGVIPIDSKFPLDNYERYVEAPEGSDDRASHRRQFARDVEAQLEKIARDYVRPEAGTARFAFAFVPSESVYYHLVSEEYDMLRAFTKRGVQVVSPLTLGHKLELVRADVHAAKLSRQAEEIRDRLEVLGARFEAVADEWETLRHHVRNAKNKADDLDREYERLHDEFDRIDSPSFEEVTE